MVKLDDVKLFLRVDHNDEDAVLETMIDSAKAAALDYLNWDQEKAEPPSPVISAILIMVGDLYENRNRQDDRQLYENRTYERLLSPYRTMCL